MNYIIDYNYELVAVEITKYTVCTGYYYLHTSIFTEFATYINIYRV